MKVLVTGANGFLGCHVVRALLKTGYEVKAFILKGTSEDTLKGLSYESFFGDLLNPADIENALDSCDYVIHTAALTDVKPTKNELSWKINYEVVKNLANAVRRKSIKKYINVGTANSFGCGTMADPGTESKEFNCGRYGLDYIDSKKAAQDYLLEEAAKSDGLPVVIINPTFMIGEFDTKPGPGEMIISVISGRVRVYSIGGRCFSAVKDVAQSCVNAIDQGKIGECYITGGTNLCYKDFFQLIAKVAGVKPPRIKIPRFLIMLIAKIAEFWANLRKRTPRFTVAMAKISTDRHFYSSEKAIRELGYHQTSLETALKEAINWYETNGYINKKRSLRK